MKRKITWAKALLVALAAQARRAGKNTKHFFALLSQVSSITAARQQEATSGTNGHPPKALIRPAALKAASVLFATGAILATANDGSGSHSGSQKICGLIYSSHGETKDYKCDSNTYCCSNEEERGSRPYVIGYCCKTKDCTGMELQGKCDPSKIEYPWVEYEE